MIYLRTAVRFGHRTDAASLSVLLWACLVVVLAINYHGACECVI